MNCLLCSSANTGVNWKRASADLVSEWEKILGIDIRQDLEGYLVVELYRCHECGFQFFNPALALRATTYARLQEQKWYYLEDKWEYDQAIRDLTGVNSVVEIGCGRGVFLEKVQRELGVRGVGLDTNPVAILEGSSRGLDMYAMKVGEYAASHKGEFYAAVLFQVLEHVPNPVEFMCAVASLVRTGGCIVLSVPNAESFLRAGVNILDMAPHHITKWNRNTLKHLAERSGIHCVTFREEPLSIHHVSSYVDTWIRERQAGLWGGLLLHWRVRRLLTKIAALRWCRRHLRGQTVYMFGVKK